MNKEQVKQSNLMKLEAMALFAGVKAHTSTERWWYFSEMRRVGRPVRLDKVSRHTEPRFPGTTFFWVLIVKYFSNEKH